MANFKPAYTPEEVKQLGVAKVREAYNKLAEDYNKIFDRKNSHVWNMSWLSTLGTCCRSNYV